MRKYDHKKKCFWIESDMQRRGGDRTAPRRSTGVHENQINKPEDKPGYRFCFVVRDCLVFFAADLVRRRAIVLGFFDYLTISAENKSIGSSGR